MRSQTPEVQNTQRRHDGIWSETDMCRWDLMEEVAPLLPSQCLGSQPLLPGVWLLTFNLSPCFGPLPLQSSLLYAAREPVTAWVSSYHPLPVQNPAVVLASVRGKQSPTGFSVFSLGLWSALLHCLFFSHADSLGHPLIFIRCLSAMGPFLWMPLYLDHSFSKSLISLLPLSTLGKRSILHDFCPPPTHTHISHLLLYYLLLLLVILDLLLFITRIYFITGKNDSENTSWQIVVDKWINKWIEMVWIQA